MTIALITEGAQAVLRSSVVLLNATSVVKELIDNALDAHATNIAIEISANTLDVIQVKDNGVGVSPGDRQLLCKKGYTSKIRTYDDLTQLGGRSLGFRGEALASIADLSESVVVTTRVDGEPAAKACVFNHQGSLTSATVASHPIGTSVRANALFHGIPVRKQTAIQQSNKILSQIKKLLFRYAFARPTVKISFRVLRSKADLKFNWSFAPCVDDSDLVLLTSKIVGKDIAGQCQQEIVSSETHAFGMKVLLLKPTSDPHTSSHEQYISADGRPLSANCSLMHAFSKIYKSHLHNNINKHIASGDRPFLVVKLHCPGGSYDVNIEPAKDDILLEDLAQVTTLFEQVCKKVYGELPSPDIPGTVHTQAQTVSKTMPFELLMPKSSTCSGERSQEPNTRGSETGDLSCIEATASAIHLASDSDQKSPADAGQSDPKHTTIEPSEDATPDADAEDSDQDVMNPRVTNPFTLAKLNTRVTPNNGEHGRDHVVTTENVNSLGRDGLPQLSPFKDAADHLLPSPASSPDRPCQNPGPPVRPWNKRAILSDHEESEQEPVVATQARPTLLDRWTQSQILTPPHSTSASRQRHDSGSAPTHSPTRVQGSHGPQLRLRTFQSRGLSHSPTKRGFRTPLKSGHCKDNSKETQSSTAQYDPSQELVASTDSNRSSALISMGQDDRRSVFESELQDIMVFENRKKEMNQRYRENLKSGRRLELPLSQQLSTSADAMGSPPGVHSSARPQLPLSGDVVNDGNRGKSDLTPAYDAPISSCFLNSTQSPRGLALRAGRERESVLNVAFTQHRIQGSLSSSEQTPVGDSVSTTNNQHRLCSHSTPGNSTVQYLRYELDGSQVDISTLKRHSMQLAVYDMYVPQGHRDRKTPLQDSTMMAGHKALAVKMLDAIS